MLNYKGINFRTEKRSLSITYQKVGVEYHYEGTDESDYFQTGVRSTVITCKVIALTDGERNILRQMTMREGSGILIIGDEYYKDVVAEMNGQATPETYDLEGEWSFPVKFIATDPYAYSVDTDEVVF